MNQHLPGRSIDWPACLSNGTDLVNLAVDLAAEIETLARGGDTLLVLAECGEAGREELLSLAAIIAEQWQRSGLRGLVVDAHPARPFLPREEPQPEGFTEVLHYGLSPERVARRRDGAAGEWIPAGGAWTLPLESPAEPERSLGRFARYAQRVLILADSKDEEGLLTSFRNACSYRIELAAGGAPVVRAAPPARRRFLPAAAYLLLLLIPVLAAGAWWLRARGAGAPAGVEVASSSKFTPLPERVPPPFGGGEAESLVKRAVGQQAARQTPATPAGAATGPEGAGDPVAQAGGGDPAQRTPQASPGAPLRRFEDRDAWRSLLDQKATFLVHVESYRDSSLGDRTARLRGYGAFGYSLRQTALGEDRWYRLCVGPFETLPAAAAFRDSLLDANAVDYCVITTAADPSARR